ncbi:MAG: AAA family ATPase, partial [Planctomycetota bacterium]
MMAKHSTSYACTACGDTYSKWAGRCASCGAMGTIIELGHAEAELVTDERSRKQAAATLHLEGVVNSSNRNIARLSTNIAELDRVLGGGLARGTALVIGGEPGIGKSTLLAQAAGALARNHAVLYVSAEESTGQVADRCQRLGVASDGLQLCASGDGDAIAGAIASGNHAVVIIDSIQLTAMASVDGIPGSVTQVRACATAFVEAAKRHHVSVLLVGHVTKDGTLAGPRLLEHLVDT